MVDRLIPHYFYKVYIFEASNKVCAQPAYIKIDFSYAMTVGILKLATDLFIWHC